MKKIFLVPLILISFFFFSSNISTFAESYEFLPAVKVPSDIKREPPRNTSPINSENKTPKFYSNDIDNKNNQFTCPFTFTISQLFLPKLIAIVFGKPIFLPYDIYHLANVKYNSQLSTNNFRNSAIYWGQKSNTNFAQIPEKNFTNLDQNGVGIAYRTMSADRQLYLKGTIIEDAVSSLKDKQDTVPLDEQLAWSCAGRCQDLAYQGDDLKLCIPIYISDIACYFNSKKNQTTSYQIESEKAIPVKFPYDLTGCYSPPVDNDCYQRLYNDLPIIPRGTVNTHLLIYNKNGGKEMPPVSYDKGLPLAAAISSRQMTYVAQSLIPAQQQIKYTSQEQVCGNPLIQDPVQDQPSPLLFTASETNEYMGHVYDTPVYVEKKLKAEAVFPKTMIQNIDLDKTFLLNFISAENQEKYKSVINGRESSTVNQWDFNYPDPGYKDDQLRQIFSNSLMPASWQKNSQ